MRRSTFGVLLVLVVLAAVGVAAVREGVFSDATTAAADRGGLPATATGPFPVVRVVDGDTVIVSEAGRDVRVRLLGIDTPESVKPDSPVECFGPEAAARTTELLAGTSVWLEADPTQDAVDQYGRTLAYVWLDEDTLVNEVLVAEGYAREYTYDEPGTHQRSLIEAEARAKDNEAGLWSPTSCSGG